MASIQLFVVVALKQILEILSTHNQINRLAQRLPMTDEVAACAHRGQSRDDAIHEYLVVALTRYI